MSEILLVSLLKENTESICKTLELGGFQVNVAASSIMVDDILQKCSDKNFAVTDLSHSRTVIQIRGLEAIEVLKKGCPINLNEFKLNNCAGTIFHGINIIVDFVSTDPNTFNLFTLRSFGETFYHHVTDAALEYGFIAI